MKTFVVVLLLCLAPLAAAASSRDTPPPPSRPEASPQEMPLGQLRVAGTIHLGQTAPDFTAVSTSGRELTLSRLKGDWLVLVFAPNREDFGALRETSNRLMEYGTRVFGICKEKPQRLRAYAEAEGLPFELLADDTGEISSLYGYYNWEQRSTTRGFIVLDRWGVVRLALQGEAPPQEVADLTRFTVSGE